VTPASEAKGAAQVREPAKYLAVLFNGELHLADMENFELTGTAF
jgi:hypothetical protein